MTRARSFLWLAALAVLAFSTVSAAQSPGGRIEGFAADSLHGGAPLVGAIVVATPDAALRDTVFHSARTNARGGFVLDQLAPGTYSVSLEHAVIDVLGISAHAVTVNVNGTKTSTAFLAIPSARALRRALCPSALQDTTVGVMLGAVRREDGSAVPNATLVFSWADFDVDAKTASVRPRQLDANIHTDSLGAYRACGLPVQRSVYVQAQGGHDAQSGILEEQIDATGILRRDFQIANTADSSRTSGRATTMAEQPPARAGHTLDGRVTNLRGGGVAGAQVTLFGTSHLATTNEKGEFRLTGVEAGTHGLRVIALGYYPVSRRVEMSAADTQVTIRMENAAVVLDSMRVLAKRSSRVRWANEEFDRRKDGPGRFFTEEQIAAMHVSNVVDIFRRMAGIGLVTPRGPGSEIVVSRRGAGLKPTCPLDIFLDGIILHRGLDTLGTPMGDLAMFHPDELHGVEVHSVATAPVKYKVGNCGALFLWTK
ncbi:MAG: carboxypeptidase regulatory-like domain-containing protein [bacterium]